MSHVGAPGIISCSKPLPLLHWFYPTWNQIRVYSSRGGRSYHSASELATVAGTVLYIRGVPPGKLLGLTE